MLVKKISNSKSYLNNHEAPNYHFDATCNHHTRRV